MVDPATKDDVELLDTVSIVGGAPSANTVDKQGGVAALALLDEIQYLDTFSCYFVNNFLLGIGESLQQLYLDALFCPTEGDGGA